MHRHQHTKGSSVFAFSAELDEWRKDRHQSLDIGAAPEQSTDNIRQMPAVAGYAATALVAAVIGGLAGSAIIKTRYATTETAIATHNLAETSWILMAETIIDGGASDTGKNLSDALRRNISRLQGYRTLPQERVRTVLGLMRQDPNTELTSKLARQVALRDGTASALLVPHIEQLGDTFVVSVEILDPYSDQLIAYPSETVVGLQSVAPVFTRLTQAVESSLQPVSQRTPSTRLPDVSTYSQRALRLYAQAAELLSGGEAEAAYELLDLAIEEDAEFASALTLQSWALDAVGGNESRILEIARAAVDLSATMPAQERYFIDGSLQHFSGERVRAKANYRALLDLQPDHVFGAQALLKLCTESGPTENCVDESVHVARLLPDDVQSNLQAAWAITKNTGSKFEAGEFANRALLIAQRDYDGHPAATVAQVLAFPAVAAWTRGDMAAAAQETQRLREALPGFPASVRQMLIRNLAEFSLALGQVGQAEDLLRLLQDPQQRYELQAMVLFASGRKVELKNHLSDGKDFTEGTTALLMSMAGLTDRAIEMHDRLRSGGMPDDQSAVIRASLALGSGDVGTARRQLQTALADLTPADGGFFFVGPDMDAMALKKQGKISAAVSTLQRTAPYGSDSIYNNAGIFWLMCQRNLANLYRDAGREYDAAQIETQLGELLQLADEDFPLLLSLKEA